MSFFLLAHFGHPTHIALYLAPAALVAIALKVAGKHVDDGPEDEDDA